MSTVSKYEWNMYQKQKEYNAQKDNNHFINEFRNKSNETFELANKIIESLDTLKKVTNSEEQA